MTVRDLMTVLVEYDMNAEVTGCNGEDIKKIDFISNGRNDICIEFEKISDKYPKIVEANAEYTGGGIYLYYGKFSNGNYLLGDSEWDCIYECDADPNCEESGYDEWCNKHCIREFVGKQYKKYLKEWLKWIQKHEPKGNYDIGDLERYIEEEM